MKILLIESNLILASRAVAYCGHENIELRI